MCRDVGLLVVGLLLFVFHVVKNKVFMVSVVCGLGKMRCWVRKYCILQCEIAFLMKVDDGPHWQHGGCFVG